MRSLFAQSLPPSDNPGPFAGVASLFGDVLGGLMWFLTHIAIEGAIVVAVVLGVVAAITGRKDRMEQSHRAFGGIVSSIALGLVALAAVTWLLSRA